MDTLFGQIPGHVNTIFLTKVYFPANHVYQSGSSLYLPTATSWDGEVSLKKTGVLFVILFFSEREERELKQGKTPSSHFQPKTYLFACDFGNSSPKMTSIEV